MKRALPALLFILVLPLLASGDTVVLVNGRPLKGGVHADDESGVAFNPYFSRNEGMVFDVQRFPRSQVMEVVYTERPFSEFVRRRKEAAGDAAALLALADWCKDEKLKEEREIVLLEILKADPAHEEALKAFGRSKFPGLARGDPDFDPEAKAAIEAYLAIRDPDERDSAFGRLKREHSVSLPRHYLDRILRSLDRKTGREDNRPLTLRANESPGVYTIFVPKEYDPRRAWPLILGLHGGGAGGREGDAVVGSGDSAMNFYQQDAAARGYIVVCPTALAMPWASTRNVPLLEALLEEVQFLLNVDLNRVYLTGHSAGGFGTWHYGPLWAERFAAISPMAGGGRGGIGRLEETHTPVFIFHGADDGVVGPDADRAAARSLAKGSLDFVYTELNGIGHGFPRSIQTDLFDFFDARRLAPMRGKRAMPPTAAVRSSFMVPVSRDEVRFLGDPEAFGETGGGGRNEVADILKAMSLGGGKAEAAADRLIELKDEHAVKPLVELMKRPNTADDVRAQAARALGGIGHEDGYAGLAAGLRSEDHAVFAASARGMASIAGEKPGEALVGSLAHLDRIVEGKRIGGNQMHISDWERWLPAYAAAVEAIAARKPEGAAAAIRRSPVRKVICAGFDVIYSRRVGQNPQIEMRRLALTAVAALESLGGEDAKKALAEIRDAQPEDTEIQSACKRALGE